MNDDRSERTLREVAAAVRRDMGETGPDDPAAGDAVLATVYRYFDAWNSRDGEAVAACFTERGGLVEPSGRGALSGAALAEHVRSMVVQFPDLSFDLLAEAGIGLNTMMVEWLMRGTDSSLGRGVAVPGIDVVVVDRGAVVLVRRLFDRVGLYEQLGLSVVLMPAGPHDEHR